MRPSLEHAGCQTRGPSGSRITARFDREPVYLRDDRRRKRLGVEYVADGGEHHARSDAIEIITLDPPREQSGPSLAGEYSPGDQGGAVHASVAIRGARVEKIEQCHFVEEDIVIEEPKRGQ